jgi:dihydroflavonol-4-reductase
MQEAQMTAEMVLVTGATGLAGSNVCRLAAERGYRVRALVRNIADAAPLGEIGVDVVKGDILSPASLDSAMRGVDHVVHCAALLGGTWSRSTAEEITAANRNGAINVLAAAERADIGRTVMFSSVAICDWSDTLTERSAIQPIDGPASPYALAKIGAYYEGMARAARGQFVATVIPGGIYGPSPFLERTLDPTSVNRTLLDAASGLLDRYLPMKMPWVFADDVAQIALNVLEKGRPGARYLATGRREDASSFPVLCNRFSELAGAPYRVEEFDPTAPGAEQDEQYGNMIRYVLQPQPEPLFDASWTHRELDFTPTAAEDGLARTLSWLRANGKL